MAVGPRGKLEKAHERFILNRIARFIEKPSHIQELLADQDTGDRYGFEPVEITAAGVGAAIKRIKERQSVELSEARAEFMIDYSDCPLAHKKIRILELEQMYHKIASEKCKKTGEVFGYRTVQQEQRAILKQIAEELDEDVETLAAAIRANKDQSPVKMYPASMLQQIALVVGTFATQKEADASD